jgi:hypothetical protein
VAVKLYDKELEEQRVYYKRQVPSMYFSDLNSSISGPRGGKKGVSCQMEVLAKSFKAQILLGNKALVATPYGLLCIHSKVQAH